MMPIRPGADAAYKEVELTRTEARAAGPGHNIDVLIFGLGGVIFAFLVILLLDARWW